jgi:DNA-binding transcriptional MerR regulator
MMLNYLERSGTFIGENAGPAHHGKKRKYTYRDLVILRAINRLLELGARPKRIQEALTTFQKIKNLPSNSDELLAFANASSFFVVTASKVFFCSTPDEIVDLSASGQLAFSFIVSSRDCFAAVAATVIDYDIALKADQPRTSQTLNKCAAKNQLAVDREN